MSSLDSTQTFPLEILHASNALAYSDCFKIVAMSQYIDAKTEMSNNPLHNYIIVLWYSFIILLKMKRIDKCELFEIFVN